MILACNFSGWLILLGVRYALAFPGIDARSASTCLPTIATVAHITTITIESIVTIPHSCYTKTITTKHHGTGCPKLPICAMQADCILLSTERVDVPPIDPCCLSTPTVTVQGPCPTCGSGCDVSILTNYVTAEANTLVKKALPTSTPCTKTVVRSEPFAVGPTKTEHVSTVTSTLWQNCNGCILMTKNAGGLGPAAIFKTTVTDSLPLTTTAFVCLP